MLVQIGSNDSNEDSMAFVSSSRRIGTSEHHCLRLVRLSNIYFANPSLVVVVVVVNVRALDALTKCFEIGLIKVVVVCFDLNVLVVR